MRRYKKEIEIIIFALVILVVSIVFIWTYWNLNKSTSKAPLLPTPPVSEEPVFCTEEAKQCPDGSFVGRSGPNCEFQKCPESETSNEFLVVASPILGQEITSPVIVSGKSNFFEASTSIRIKDANGNVLAETFTTADGWMDDLYPFSKSVEYTTPSVPNGVVEVFEESPKDGSEINKITIPVIFLDYLGEASKEGEVVNLSKCGIAGKIIDFRMTDKYGMFGDDEFDTAVCGYLVTEEVEVFGDKINSAKLRIVEFSDTEFKKSIKEGINEGNSVNSSNGDELDFGLGCFENGKVWGDSAYPEGEYINDETNVAIVNSSKNSPVALVLSFGFHGGRGCTCCNLAHLIRVIK